MTDAPAREDVARLLQDVTETVRTGSHAWPRGAHDMICMLARHAGFLAAAPEMLKAFRATDESLSGLLADARVEHGPGRLSGIAAVQEQVRASINRAQDGRDG